jgi:hypothetical protein
MQLWWEQIELSCWISCKWLPGLKFVCIWHSARQVPSVWSEVQECPWTPAWSIPSVDLSVKISLCALIVLYMTQMCFTKIFAAKVAFPDHGTHLYFWFPHICAHRTIFSRPVSHCWDGEESKLLACEIIPVSEMADIAACQTCISCSCQTTSC